MKYSIPAKIVLLLCLLAGCSVPATIVGQPGEKTRPESVRIYYTQRPQCEFETIALVQVEGSYYSLQSMFDQMRSQAAEVGANGLYVLHTQRLETKEYLGTAKAIRCLPA